MERAAEIRKEVEQFWDARPCDSDRSRRLPGTKEYFLDIEADRYSLQRHIRDEILSKIDWRDKAVLEIGTGVGTDARVIISGGADYTGINIDRGSVEVTRQALEVFGLPGKVEQHDATRLPYADESFDVIYSFGAFPCIPDLPRAIGEIHRVLKPGGQVLGLLYNRSSINYHVEIMFLRRLLRPVLAVPGAIPLLSALGLPRDRLEGHRVLFQEKPRMSAAEWLSRNTDGPDNPYISVQDRFEAENLFARFKILSHEVYFFDYRHWGIAGRLMPAPFKRYVGRRWGWHRVVHATKPEAVR